jgi:hypothetical protein
VREVVSSATVLKFDTVVCSRRLFDVLQLSPLSFVFSHHLGEHLQLKELLQIVVSRLDAAWVELNLLAFLLRARLCVVLVDLKHLLKDFLLVHSLGKHVVDHTVELVIELSAFDLLS